MVAPTMIKEHMEVLGADGVHVGTVDQLEGRDQVKLTKDDPDAGGEHHFIKHALKHAACGAERFKIRDRPQWVF